MKHAEIVISCMLVATMIACKSGRATLPQTPPAPAATPTTELPLQTPAPTRDLTSSTVEFELEIKGDPHPLGTIHGIAVDPQGSLYVVECMGSQIQKFDSQGNFLTVWGGEGTEDGQFKLWIDTAHSVPSGDVAWGLEGLVYVADTANSRIQVFDSNGQFLFGWGEEGTGEGQFYTPSGVAVGPEGDVYVVDMTRGDVQRFDSEGNFLTGWSVPDLGFQHGRPIMLAVGPSGSVYVPTVDTKDVSQYSGEGKLLSRIGEGGTGDGQFSVPKAAAVDSQGNLYVADQALHRVQVFDTEGKFLRSWGGMGAGEGEFRGPCGLAVAPDGSVYVADGNQRVQKFRQS